MQSPVRTKRPFIVAHERGVPHSRASRFLDRLVEQNPWILALLFTAFLFVCNAGLDFYMLKHRESTIATVEVSDVISALVAGVLFLKVAQYRRERRLAIRRRLEAIGDMNHHIRNALEVISLSAHTSTDQQSVKQIRESVDRITWTLKEILPKM